MQPELGSFVTEGGLAGRAVGLFDRLVAAINAHDIDGIIACYDEGVTNHGMPAGHAGMRAVHETIFAAFPDWHLEVNDRVVSRDRLVARGRLRGTHLGRCQAPMDRLLFGGVLAGVEPSGRRIDIAAIHLWEVAEDRVVAHWAVRDDLAMLRQLVP